MISRRAWIYILLLLPVMEAASNKGFWKNTSPGIRFDKSGSVVFTAKLSLIMCSCKCSGSDSCVSLNYQNSSRTCELLNTAPIPSDTSSMVSLAFWNHYTFAPQILPLDGSVLCPAGSILVPYDIPAFNSYDPSVEGYICTDNSWILDKHAQGQKDCRMKLLYETEFYGYDAPNWNGVWKPYHVALRNCYANKCIGLICITSLDRCWLKVKTHLMTNKSPTNDKGLHYWYTDCQ